MDFFIVNTKSGIEKQTKELLEQRIGEEGHSKRFGRILVPTENVMITKNNKRTVVQKRIAPAYLMVEMENDMKLFSFLRTISGVYGVLGNPPKPLSKEETKQLITWITAKPTSVKGLRKGDSVQIKEGPFKDFAGILQEINGIKAKVSVIMFGQETNVMVDPLILVKIC
jgi:transcriptional antiterminator NusG